MKEKTEEISPQESFYKEAFSRNVGIFSLEEQKKLKNAKVAIAGMGGVGGQYLLSLARLGIGGFSIADPDIFETVNVNRQAGANAETFGRQKCEVMEKMAKAINPFSRVDVFPEGINSQNIESFLSGSRVAVDGLDFFSINERIMFFKKAREMGIWAITSPPIGFGASLLVFDPRRMAFEEYFDIREDMDNEEKMLRFSLGLSPALIQRSYFRPASIDFSNKKTPSLVAGPLMCSALVTCEIAKIIFGKEAKPVPYVTQFDPYVRKYKKTFLRGGNRNIKQRIKLWYVKKYMLKKGMSKK